MAIDGAVLHLSPLVGQVITFIKAVLVSCAGQISQPPEVCQSTTPVSLVLISIGKP